MYLPNLEPLDSKKSEVSMQSKSILSKHSMSAVLLSSGAVMVHFDRRENAALPSRDQSTVLSTIRFFCEFSTRSATDKRVIERSSYHVVSI